MCIVGTCLEDRAGKENTKKEEKVVEEIYKLGLSNCRDLSFHPIGPQLEFGPLAFCVNKSNPLSFDDARSKLGKEKAKKKKLKEISDFGKKVDIYPPYFVCLYSKNSGRLSSEGTSSSIESMEEDRYSRGSVLCCDSIMKSYAANYNL